jgi:uncharacterized protein YukE
MDMKVAILFTAVDRLGQVMGNMSRAFEGLSERISGAGERLQKHGEHMALVGAIASEGAEHLKSFAEAAIEPAEGMQSALAHTAAATNLSSEALERLRSAAVDFSATHAGATAVQYVGVFTQLQGVMQNAGAAMMATNTAIELAKVAGIDTSQAAAMLTTAYANLAGR